MLFLLDAISVSVQYAHYKVFEVDTDVYFASSTTKWKNTAQQPPEFYLSKINWRWQSDIGLPENLFTEITDALDSYLEARRMEAKRK